MSFIDDLYGRLMQSVFSSPTNGVPWLIRADFTDQQVWDEVRRAVAVDPARPGGAPIEFVLVDDRDFDGLTPAGLLQLNPDEFGIYFVVDHLTITHPDRPILAVDVIADPGKSFRLVPAAVPSFGVHLMSSTMDFDDFDDGVDPDGIFRGVHPAPGAAGAPPDAHHRNVSPG